MIPAAMISLWSVTGVFQYLPRHMDVKWGMNVIRVECFARLIISIVAMYYDDFWNESSSSSGRTTNSEQQRTVVLLIMLLFGIYPYAMEWLFQTPLAMFCKGNFFILHEIDGTTSLPNELRLIPYFLVCTYTRIHIYVYVCNIVLICMLYASCMCDVDRLYKDLPRLKWKNGLIYMSIRQFLHLQMTYGKSVGEEVLLKMKERILSCLENFVGFGSSPPRLYRETGKDVFICVVAFQDVDTFKNCVTLLSQIRVVATKPKLVSPDDLLSKEDLEAMSDKEDFNLQIEDQKQGTFSYFQQTD
ncbi:hypothetical protein RFI_16384 [Reticulomyxa filosa]|uniref:Uncharacterized protein n=1 Tax=Reticulomyxa filosa TaxID=46433 RepID=X6N4Z6_RETFI|nr:hypothetical protein RFI_16384 [Reticulomyxa filosa]|eukprot:ETO20824.1 hypothetical protein RFI_16384 [Reticulomyxa filosa]